MKKQILILALVLIGITATSFAAGNPEANKYALVSFNRQFAGASDANWENNSRYQKVSFRINNQSLFAYYSAQGELLAVSRYIASSQLPVQLLISLKNDFSDCWISDLFEIHIDGDTFYYVTMENGSRKILLKSNNFSSWEQFKSENK